MMRRAILAVVTILAVLTACASVQTVSQTRAYLRVRNDHWLEQVVYANCGSKIRMGTATGIRETLLKVPRACEDRSVSFSTDPIGSNEISQSDALDVHAGDVLQLHVPALFNGYLFLSR